MLARHLMSADVLPFSLLLAFDHIEIQPLPVEEILLQCCLSSCRACFPRLLFFDLFLVALFVEGFDGFFCSAMASAIPCFCSSVGGGMDSTSAMKRAWSS
jgi:hypothetical protein